MRKQIDVNNYLFIDLQRERIADFNESDYIAKHPNDEQLKVIEHYPEYNYLKSFCLGYFSTNPAGDIILKVSSHSIKDYNNSEKILLYKLGTLLDNTSKRKLSSFNLVGNDIPFLVKRYIINELTSPNKIDFTDLKPWSQEVMDISNLWRSTSWVVPTLDEVHSTLNKFPHIVGEEELYYNLYRTAEVLLRIVKPTSYINQIEVASKPTTVKEPIEEKEPLTDDQLLAAVKAPGSKKPLKTA